MEEESHPIAGEMVSEEECVISFRSQESLTLLVVVYSACQLLHEQFFHKNSKTTQFSMLHIMLIVNISSLPLTGW